MVEVFGLKLSDPTQRLLEQAREAVHPRALKIGHMDEIRDLCLPAPCVYWESYPGIFIDPSHPELDEDGVAHELGHVILLEQVGWPVLEYDPGLPTHITQEWDSYLRDWAQHLAIADVLRSVRYDIDGYAERRRKGWLKMAQSLFLSGSDSGSIRTVVTLGVRVAEGIHFGPGPEMEEFCKRMGALFPESLALGRRLSGCAPFSGLLTKQGALLFTRRWITEMSREVRRRAPDDPVPFEFTTLR